MKQPQRLSAAVVVNDRPMNCVLHCCPEFEALLRPVPVASGRGKADVRT